jgi:hypothetical protein
MPETKKLHYSKYLYRMQFRNRLAFAFRTEWQRNGKLSYAAQQLSNFREGVKKSGIIYKNRWGFTEEISFEELRDAEVLLRLLKPAEGYMVRVELNSLNIYTNDILLLEDLKSKLLADAEIWRPSKKTVEFLKQNKNVILVDKDPKFPYKISFGRKPAKKELAKWIENNRDKVSCGPRLFESLQTENRWIQGQYIFAKDDKVILLLQMLIGDNITRIDKLVYKETIDK